MTYICGYVDPDRKLGFLGANGTNHGLSKGRIEKTRFLLGRWVVAAYGSSLILTVLDELAYFNDKSISFSVDSLTELQDQIASVARILIPRLKNHLVATRTKAHLQHHLLEIPSGLAVLDRQTFRLFSIQYSGLYQLTENTISATTETECEPCSLWSLTLKIARLPLVAVLKSLEDVVRIADPFLRGNPSSMEPFSYIALSGAALHYKPLWENPESKCSDALSENTCLVMGKEF